MFVLDKEEQHLERSWAAPSTLDQLQMQPKYCGGAKKKKRGEW